MISKISELKLKNLKPDELIIDHSNKNRFKNEVHC
jgi:hypothetical protein